MDKQRQAAWEAAIAKLRRGEEVPAEEHYALLREDMFAGEATPDVFEEADLFLDYWLYHLSLDPIPWLGEIIASSWFRKREWDEQWDTNRAQEALRDYIAADDFDHWQALSLIAARLHRERKPFPAVLADWAAEVHEGKRTAPKKERADKGLPPYVNEDRNGVFFAADDWLKYYGMGRADDRVAVIAAYTGASEYVVKAGLKRHDDDRWRRAPWPIG